MATTFALASLWRERRGHFRPVSSMSPSGMVKSRTRAGPRPLTQSLTWSSRPEGKPVVFRVPDDSEDDDDIDAGDESVEKSAAVLFRHGFQPLWLPEPCNEVIDLTSAQYETSDATGPLQASAMGNEASEQDDEDAASQSAFGMPRDSQESSNVQASQQSIRQLGQIRDAVAFCVPESDDEDLEPGSDFDQGELNLPQPCSMRVLMMREHV